MTLMRAFLCSFPFFMSILYQKIKNTTFAAIDFESAGTATGKTDAPVQIGIATWSLEEGIKNQWVSYLFTEKEITWQSQQVHGISKEDLKKAPSLLSLWQEIKQRLEGAAVVAHGHGTEKRFLLAFPGHGFSPWIDTLQLYRRAYAHLPSHTLGDLCDQFQLSQSIVQSVPEKKWHDALFDSVASLKLLEYFILHFRLERHSVSVLNL